MQDSGWLPLVKGLHCSQQKGLFLLFNKKQERSKSMHYVTVLMLVTVGTIPLHNLAPLYRKNSQQLDTNCSLEKQGFKIIPFIPCWADFFTVIFVNPFKECQESTQAGNNYQGGSLLHWLQTKIKITVLYLLTTVLYFPYSTLDILWNIQN